MSGSNPGKACHLIDQHGSVEFRLEREAVKRRLLEEGFFWLDLSQPGEEDFTTLREVFGFHPLALEDAEHFGQRPKLDEYDDIVYIVVYGASQDEDRLAEVHCFYSERFLVTVHRDDCPAFGELRERYATRHAAIDEGPLLLYRVIDQLVDSFFPLLASLDDRIDELEEAVFAQPSDQQLQEIFAMKRLLVGLRKIVTPQRDLFARMVGGVHELPGMTSDSERYFRDVYDHLIRISDLIDSYRDLLTGAMDVYLSTVSNRLNLVMKQLAIIATVFLPLSFLTGFFGQNFSYLVNHIGGLETFVGVGVGTELVTVVLLVVLFRRRGWL